MLHRLPLKGPSDPAVTMADPISLTRGGATLPSLSPKEIIMEGVLIILIVVCALVVIACATRL